MSDSINQPGPEIIEGEFPDPVNLFYLQWGEETLKQAIPKLNDGLQRVGTFATALLGGSLWFVSEAVLPAGCRAGAMVMFLAALAVSFFGGLPNGGEFSVRDPAAVKAFKTATAERRLLWLRISTAFLWVGLAVATLGVIAKAVAH